MEVFGADKQPDVSPPISVTNVGGGSFNIVKNYVSRNYFAIYENWFIYSKLTRKLFEFGQSAKYCNGTRQQCVELVRKIYFVKVSYKI